LKIFTIGHSNHDISKFVSLLKNREIDVLVDVRTSPYSKHVPHFNKKKIETSLRRDAILYLYMGNRLGGLSSSGSGGRTLKYREVSKDEVFLSAIDELLKIAEKKRVVIMCAEKDPNRCHRKHLISQELKKRKVEVIHILSDSTEVRDEDYEIPTLFDDI
jgi:uncharacterized protein (DUF488 family)